MVLLPLGQAYPENIGYVYVSLNYINYVKLDDWIIKLYYLFTYVFIFFSYDYFALSYV